MIIDFHTHAFPDKVAPLAMGKLTYASGGIFPQTDGTLSALKAELKKDGVDLAVVHCIATNPHQQSSVNRFAMEVNRTEGFVAFGSVHPDAPDALEELERIKDAGLKGVKFHPEYQQFFVDDEKMKPIYRKISQLGLITQFHAGNDPAFSPPFHGTPERLLRALKWFDTPVVAAHWGSLGCSGEVLEYLCGRDIWFDLSFGSGVIPESEAQKIVDKHGPDRLLFASDMPWHRPKWELSLLAKLDISSQDREKILYRNAKALLGL